MTNYAGLPQWSSLLLACFLLMLSSELAMGSTCSPSCGGTTPQCCTTFDSDICCPANSGCDINQGCVLSTSSSPVTKKHPKKSSAGLDNATKPASSDTNLDEYPTDYDADDRSPLHEAFTVVFIQFASVLRLVAMGTMVVAAACVFGYVHTTVVLRLHAWYRQRRERQETEERGESSDEEPICDYPSATDERRDSVSPAPATSVVRIDERVESVDHAVIPVSASSTRRQFSSKDSRRRNTNRNDDDDELLPLTAAVSRETSPSNSPPPGLADVAYCSEVSHEHDNINNNNNNTAVVNIGNIADTTTLIPQAPVASSAAPPSSPGDGESTCLKCNAAINCVLLRCNHAVVCYTCARRLRDCPKCDVKIHKRQRLFFV